MLYRQDACYFPLHKVSLPKTRVWNIQNESSFQSEGRKCRLIKIIIISSEARNLMMRISVLLQKNKKIIRQRMSGIYIHIPFCVKKCEYCNFFSLTDVSLKDTFLAALEKEIVLRAAYLPQDKIQCQLIQLGIMQKFLYETDKLCSWALKSLLDQKAMAT